MTSIVVGRILRILLYLGPEQKWKNGDKDKYHDTMTLIELMDLTACCIKRGKEGKSWSPPGA